ncbi:MAG: glutathione S-transferase family protein [Phenylobacterium sp.]
MVEIVLHHYDTSPFSEKVRVMLGIKGLAWASVIQPVIMPKPELIPLTGGYRRIPVMQIGADVYCDSQVILAELEARHPDPPVVRPGDWAVNLWADRIWFQATVAVIFGEMGDRVPKAFIADREKLSGRPFDTAAMQAAAGPMRAQWRAQAAWLDQGLKGQDYLGGSTPSLADVAAWMNVWWLFGAMAPIAGDLSTGFTRLLEWRNRMAGIKHGTRQDLTGAQALEIARAAEPGEAPRHDPDDPSGLPVGAQVTVRADDYGRDPIAGKLVSASAERIVIERDDGQVGRVNVHFPRMGFILAGTA